MLDIKFIRENTELVKKGVAAKNLDPQIVEKVLLADRKRRELQEEVEKLRADRNILSVSPNPSPVPEKDEEEKREQARNVKDRLKLAEDQFKQASEEYKQLILQIPNLPAHDVEEGKDESENKVIRKWGEIRYFDFKPKSHDELGEILDIIDIKRAAKVSGTRFGYIKNELATLELSLMRFAFDTLVSEGFKPVLPPVMISISSMKAMGYTDLENMYVLKDDGLVLAATSEQSIGPMYKDEVLEEKNLPLRYVGFSTCFRREAGSYGKDTKGILRVHQFNKTEMFSFARPEESDREHDYLLSLEERFMQKLELPYQVVKMVSGDLGFPAARKYDIETWLPSENRYRETHSTSTCTDFQARRLNIKYRQKDGQLAFVHTLNGTAFSERPLLAILENYQEKDGSVRVPYVLQKYTGFEKINLK